MVLLCHLQMEAGGDEDAQDTCGRDMDALIMFLDRRLQKQPANQFEARLNAVMDDDP